MVVFGDNTAQQPESSIPLTPVREVEYAWASSVLLSRATSSGAGRVRPTRCTLRRSQWQKSVAKLWCCGTVGGQIVGLGKFSAGAGRRIAPFA